MTRICTACHYSLKRHPKKKLVLASYLLPVHALFYRSRQIPQPSTCYDFDTFFSVINTHQCFHSARRLRVLLIMSIIISMNIVRNKSRTISQTYKQYICIYRSVDVGPSISLHYLFFWHSVEDYILECIISVTVDISTWWRQHLPETLAGDTGAK